jgi:hypothetical protein
MSGIYTDYWRIVKPAPEKSKYVQSSPEAAKLYSNFSWYTKVMKGANTRFTKYSQYKSMDTDVFISRALDTIAEEMTPSDSQTDLNFEIAYQNESNSEIPEAVTMTVRAALRHWSDAQNLDMMMFDIARTVIKYGDCFFQKFSDMKPWKYIDPQDIIGISIDDDGRPLTYHIRTGEKNKQGAFGDVMMVPADGMIHFSLTSMMGKNGPFGESVLWPTIKAWRHLSLLEDSVIIYRIVRAPERRIFFIDVGNMPPQRIQQYLDKIKTDMRQKRIPNEQGGTDRVDSVYNPISQTEDFFFAQTADGRGSKVETLPGGENLGEISDLNYFQNKFLQGLRIPSSYMRGGDANGAQITDGKVGIAYIEEVRFANYVARLQKKINRTFDQQFKAFLKSSGLKIDPDIFKIKLPDPQNFKDYKNAEVYEKMLSNYGNVKDDKTMSVRLKQRIFLGWNEDQIQENEILLKQENGIPDKGISEGFTDLRMLYDQKYIENRPDIKLPETYDDFSGAAEEAPEEEAEGADAPTDSGGENTKSDDKAKAEEAPEDLDSIGDDIEKL